MGRNKITWSSDLLFELKDQKQRGKSLRDMQDYIFSKFGVKITAARISQVLKDSLRVLQERGDVEYGN